MTLADGKIAVHSADNHRLLRQLPYDEVDSITYSRGFDPLWKAPEGPTRVTRAAGGKLAVFGIYVERDWVSLRTTNANFVVLRFDEEAQARRAVAALENRTGLRVERIRK